jgi:hypothetical protein
MNRAGIKNYMCMLAVCLSAFLLIQVVESAAFERTNKELDDLLAPIALYPDPVLAVLLPASTYPTEVADAATWLRNGGEASMIENENWDESVKAISHYPDILNMMADNLDWTADLGDAFLSQPENVAGSIQRLRWRAKDMGNLTSTDQQSVIIDGDNVEIIPAQPQYMYIPRYDPSIVYVERWTPGISPFITFGLGLAVGSWLIMDFDWHQHHVIYHGWNRYGWVNNARRHVRVTNVYVNRSRPYINQTWRHDASHGDPDTYRSSHTGSITSAGRYVHIPEVRGRDIKPARDSGQMFGPKGDARTFSNRGRESRDVTGTRMTTPPPGFSRQPTTPALTIDRRQPAPIQDVSKRLPAPAQGTGSRPSQPTTLHVTERPIRAPSNSFGGYRGNNEAKSQSLRGQTSRQSSEGARPSTAPINRGSAPASKGGTESKEHRK